MPQLIGVELDGSSKLFVYRSERGFMTSQIENSAAHSGCTRLMVLSETDEMSIFRKAMQRCSADSLPTICSNPKKIFYLAIHISMYQSYGQHTLE